MELRKAYASPVADPVSTGGVWIKRLTIGLFVAGGVMLSLPMLAAYGLKTGFEHAVKKGDEMAGIKPQLPPSPSITRPAVPDDPNRYITPIANVAGESRMPGFKVKQLILVGIDYGKDAGKPHTLDLTLNMAAETAAILISREPATFNVTPSTNNYRIHTVFEGAQPVNIVARDRSIVAMRDGAIPPMPAVNLAEADVASKAKFCSSLRRWSEYFAVPLESINYWYLSDPKYLKVTALQAISGGSRFKIYSEESLGAACPGLAPNEIRTRSKFPRIAPRQLTNIAQ